MVRLFWMARSFRIFRDNFRLDSAVGEAGFNLIAGAERGGIAESMAVLEGDAESATEQEGRVEALGFFLDELQAVLLGHQAAVEEDGEPFLKGADLRLTSDEALSDGGNDAAVECIETGLMACFDGGEDARERLGDGG